MLAFLSLLSLPILTIGTFLSTLLTGAAAAYGGWWIWEFLRGLL